MESTEARLHRETWGLLPVLVNGRADEAERRRAHAHLAACPSCRAELEREQRLAAAMSMPDISGPDLPQGLARLMQRVDQVQPLLPAWQRGLAGARRTVSIRLSTAAAVGALQLCLVAAAAAWWSQGLAPAARHVAGYQTLTEAPGPALAAKPGLRVVFKPGQRIDDMQALLVARGLTIVGGPTQAGVFTLSVDAPLAAHELDLLAAELQRSPAIALAEAIGPVASR